MASPACPDATIANSGDQVFVATPYPASGQIPMQSIDQPPPFASQPTVVSMPPSGAGAFKLNTRVTFSLGICTVVFGSIAFICGICATAALGELDYNEASGGIWGGAIIIASGIIAIISSRKPQSRVLNWVNLALHSFGLAVCIVVLALCSLNIDYYDGCIHVLFSTYSRYYPYSRINIINKNCPEDRKGGLATYSLIVICICAQLGISTAMVVLCSRAHSCCRRCTDDCNCGYDRTNYRSLCHSQNNLQSFQTGYATMSSNVQPIPSGQILYMMTPVAVSTQHPQNAHANPIPQANLVMNSS